jgi:transposase
MDQDQDARIIGFDSHPDSFTAAIMRGEKAMQAQCLQMFNKVPMSGLEAWAKKHTRAQDTICLEASGNSFQIVRQLAKLGRKAIVLESYSLGKLKEGFANNDKISAVRIAKGYMSGFAKIVWVPDLITQQRRDLFHAHQKAVRRSTQMRNRIQSYLNDNGVRLPAKTTLEGSKATSELLRKLSDWSPLQWMLLDSFLRELQQAEEERAKLRQIMAEEVIRDEKLLSLTRLCGIRDVIAFALAAFIGDIKRFASPKALVKYIGLHPAFDNSGEGKWSGGIQGHGHKKLRSLLIESGQAILRSKHPIAGWGKKLLARKSKPNIAVAALARKLVVAIWYHLNGKAQPLTEIDKPLALKVGRIITNIGVKRIKEMGKTRLQLRKETFDKLKSTKIYVLDPKMKLERKTESAVVV